MMAKYRKRPVTIEAEQYDGMNPLGVAERIGDPVYAEIEATGVTLYVRTLEGPLRVSPGDWIITGVAGEKYPCKPAIFEQTYELVE